MFSRDQIRWKHAIIYVFVGKISLRFCATIKLCFNQIYKEIHLSIQHGAKKNR